MSPPTLLQFAVLFYLCADCHTGGCCAARDIADAIWPRRRSRGYDNMPGGIGAALSALERRGLAKQIYPGHWQPTNDGLAQLHPSRKGY